MKYRIKNNLRGIPTTFIFVMCIGLISLGMILTYPTIHEAADRYKDQELGSGDLSDILIQANYALYSEMEGQELIREYNDEDSNEEIEQSLANEWFNNLVRNYTSIEYAAINNMTKSIKSNIRNIHNKLREEVLTNIQLEEEYEFYTVMEYDKQGNLNVLFDSMNEDTTLKANLLNTEQSIKSILSIEGLNQIRDMTYFYGISKEKQYIDRFSWDIENSLVRGYREVAIKIMYGVTLIIVIGALIVPNRLIINSKILNKIIKMPIEILVSITGFIIWVQLNTVAEMIKSYRKNRIIYWLGFYIEDMSFSPVLVKLLNFMAWFIYFGMIVLLIWSIKSAYQQGIKKYLKKNSLIVRGCNYIKLNLIKKIDLLSHTHFEELESKKLKQFMLINGVILSVLCCLWFFGIIGVVVYIISVYWFMNKILNRVKYYYQKLLDTTSDLARGELDTETLEEDIGAFEPLKQHIKKIQYDFKRSIEEEVRSQKIKTDLITNVSHDLRTPLTSIISYIDLLKQDNLADDIKKQYVDILDRKSIRLQTLIEDLFEISKASSGNIKLNIEQVDVVALIKQTLFELEDRIKETSITFRTNFPQHKVYLMLDGARSFRVFDNLINNITKYSMPNSRAYIEIEEMRDEVVIIFKNIAREELDFDPEQITERFVRGDTSRKTEGSGLGLAIAKSFVELQGGSFRIEIDGDLFKCRVTFNKE